MKTIRAHISSLLRPLDDRSGTSAIEFAILAPLFLLLLLGLVAYGIYFGASHSVQQISADTARAAVAGVNAADREALANGFVARNAGQYLFIDPRKLTVEVGDSVADASQFDVIVSSAAAPAFWRLAAAVIAARSVSDWAWRRSTPSEPASTANAASASATGVMIAVIMANWPWRSRRNRRLAPIRCPRS